MRLHISSAVVAAVLVAGSIPSPRAQSLADVAKKEQERRRSVKPAEKVLTNKDLGAGATVPAAPASETAKSADAAAAAKPAEPPKQEEPQPAKDEAYWRGRMTQLRTQLDRDQTLADAMQTRINSLTADFVNRDDPAQRGVIERDRQRALTELNRLAKAIEDGKKAIADLEEEARRAGAPPGWLR